MKPLAFCIAMAILTWILFQFGIINMPVVFALGGITGVSASGMRMRG